jgi:uncharacterized membrane protein
MVVINLHFHKILIVTLAVLLLTPIQGYATKFLSYKIVGKIEDSQVVEDVVIVLLNDGTSDLLSARFTVPEGFEIISVRDSYGELRYTASISGIVVDFFFMEPIKPGETRVIILKLRSNSLITDKNGYSEYLLVFTPRTPIQEFEHVLILPKDSKLYSPKESAPLVFPDANVSYKDDKPVITWKKELEANQPEVFLARYKVNKFGLLRYILVGIVALGGSAFIALVGVKFRSRYRKIKALNSLKILNERERSVIEMIIKNEGLPQYQLQLELGYSKASLSKILAKLESRGLIRKKRFGKINKLYIGDKLR